MKAAPDRPSETTRDADPTTLADRIRSGRSPARRGVWWASTVFMLVALVPVMQRISHPTILGDDVIRLVDSIEHPLRDLLFRTFSEHTTPLFELVSWSTWQLVGHDLRWAPLGYSVAAVVSWMLVLGLLLCWLYSETGSRTASLVVLAVVAQSPLVLETAWWYSASSFLWAIAGILLALLGASRLAERPRGACILITLGAAMGPAGTSVGFLAAPLAIVRGVLEPRISRRVKGRVVLAALGGLATYLVFCRLGGTDAFAAARRNNHQMADPILGLAYALTIPGRLLLPSVLGLPASWAAAPIPSWLVWGAGVLSMVAMGLLVFWPRAPWNRWLVVVGAAMIYMGYGLTYCTRANRIKQGLWTEAEMIYQNGGRYHVVPLLGLALILAAVFASWRLTRRCDARPGLPALIGAAVGLAMLVVQYHEVSTRWHWMLHQPDQKATLAALHRVGIVAREEGITRSQLLRIVDPAYRPWNGSLVSDCLYAFPLVKLVADAPQQAMRPLSDDEARNLLRARLTRAERLALGSGACVSLNPVRPRPEVHTLAVARRVGIHEAREVKPGVYRSEPVPGNIEYEFDPVPEARFLMLPGLKADQDVAIFWCEQGGRWRPGQNIRWLQSPRTEASAVVDLDRLIYRSGRPISRIAIHFTRPGELTLQGPPRLLR
jgi:hypothetical protein